MGSRLELTQRRAVTSNSRFQVSLVHNLLPSKEAGSLFIIIHDMDNTVGEPFLASSQCPDSCQHYQYDHELLLLKKNIRHTWWLKVVLILLLLPTIILFVLSYLQWSGSRHPRPRQHYIYPDMILSESSVSDRRGKTCLLSFF